MKESSLGKDCGEWTVIDRKEFKARIVDNFVEVYENIMGYVDCGSEQKAFDDFAEKITGKKVTIIQYKYRNNEIDYFVDEEGMPEQEVEDFPLPEEAFERL